MDEKIIVSIICNAYNHEKYITDALESFIKQKTTFTYEILVNDDCSTDRTADIIRNYSKKYPELIKPLYHNENQESQGKDSTIDFQIPRAQGKYIAFCEGDDYWTDENKLQIQFEAMEEHPEIDLCAHAVQRVNKDTKAAISKIAPSEGDKIFPLEDVIMGGGGFVGTNSLFFRASKLKNVPAFYRVFPYDYALQLYGAISGGMLYLKNCMSAYRVAADGSWSTMKKSKAEAMEYATAYNLMCSLFDQFTHQKYTGVIQKRKEKRYFLHLNAANRYADMLQPEYKEFFKELSFQRRIKVYILSKIGKMK